MSRGFRAGESRGFTVKEGIKDAPFVVSSTGKVRWDDGVFAEAKAVWLQAKQNGIKTTEENLKSIENAKAFLEKRKDDYVDGKATKEDLAVAEKLLSSAKADLVVSRDKDDATMAAIDRVGRNLNKELWGKEKSAKEMKLAKSVHEEFTNKVREIVPTLLSKKEALDTAVAMLKKLNVAGANDGWKVIGEPIVRSTSEGFAMGVMLAGKPKSDSNFNTRIVYIPLNGQGKPDGLETGRLSALLSRASAYTDSPLVRGGNHFKPEEVAKEFYGHQYVKGD